MEIIKGILANLIVKMFGDKIERLPKWLISIISDVDVASNNIKIESVRKYINLNEDGEGVHRRHIEGLSYTENSGRYILPTHFRIESLDSVSISNHRITNTDGNHDVNIIDAETAELNKIGEIIFDGRISIEGPLGSNGNKADFIIAWNFQDVLSMSYEEASRLYSDSNFPHEYVSLKVPTDVDTIGINIDFPKSFVDNFEVSPYMTVFENITTENIHKSENTIVRTMEDDLLNKEYSSFRFKYDNPVSGLSYAMCWMPPQK